MVQRKLHLDAAFDKQGIPKRIILEQVEHPRDADG